MVQLPEIFIGKLTLPSPEGRGFTALLIIIDRAAEWIIRQTCKESVFCFKCPHKCNCTIGNNKKYIGCPDGWNIPSPPPEPTERPRIEWLRMLPDGKYVAGETKDTSLYDITLHFNLKNRKIPFCTLIEINDKHYFYIDYLMLHHFFMQIENIDLDVYDVNYSRLCFA